MKNKLVVTEEMSAAFGREVKRLMTAGGPTLESSMASLQWFADTYFPSAEPIPIILWCPSCNTRHIDEGEFATRSHHSHACQTCGLVWRPAIVPTVGVQFLPGFKDKK